MEAAMKLVPDLKLNHTEYTAALANEGASIEVFLYRSSGDYNPGGMKFTLNFTMAYEDPDPEMVQSLSVEDASGQDFLSLRRDVRRNWDGGPWRGCRTAAMWKYAAMPCLPPARWHWQTTRVTVSYGGQTVEQEIEVSSAPVIGGAEMKNGQFIMEQPLYDEHDAHVVVRYGAEKGLMDITVPAGVSVTLNDTEQTVTENGICSLALDTSAGATGTVNTIVLGFGEETST